MRQFEQGYLALVAIVLILVGGVAATVIGHLFTVDADASDHHRKTTQAFYIANAGLDRAVYGLLTSNASDVMSCSGINGNANYTNVAMGDGRFTVTTTGYNPNPVATLSSGISASSTILPVSTISGYASNGRVLIDEEAINYSGVSTASADCAGNPPCFYGANRGVDGTSAVAHAAGAALGQNQCHLVSEGVVPDFTSPVAMRQVSRDYLQGQEAWVVGNTSGGDVILEWDGSSWTRYGPTTAVPDVNYNAIDMLSYADGWAVGEKTAGLAPAIIHYNGSTWTQFAAPSGVNDSLNDISCVASNACFAVGDKKTLIQWNGVSWSVSSSTGLPNKNIYGVDCVTGSDCWAVGEKSGNALFLHWNGSTWSQVTPDSSVGSVNFNDVNCYNSNDCWAVGDLANFAHWNGSAWFGVTPAASVPNVQIDAVYCSASNDCWAVGNKNGGDALIVHWNGSSWSRVTPAASVPNQNLFDVVCYNEDNCWAVGAGKAVVRWDGSQWSEVVTSLGFSTNLNGISALGPNNPGSSNLLGQWEEQFN